ncbi:MAG: hypothetical protein Alpg2KO_20230 [Alphaproteobacteria bacterium]
MKTIAAEFPVPREFSPDAFCDKVRNWVLGSHHNAFDPTNLPPIEVKPKQHYTDGKDELEIVQVTEGERDMVAIQYILRQGGLNWVTEGVYSRNTKDCWCSVRLTVTADKAGRELPQPLVPLLAKQILDAVPGAKDGAMPIQADPHLLEDAEADFVAELMEGNPPRHLPVIFISAFGGKPLRVDAQYIAAKLAGMAHILVEPHRGFSFLLKDKVSVPNAFAGTIGVYWPETRFVDLLHPEDRFEQVQSEMQDRLIKKVIDVMAGRKPLPRLMRDTVLKALTRQEQAAAKAEVEAVADELIEQLDTEADELDARLEQVEAELAQANAQIEALQAALAGQAGADAAAASGTGKLVLATGGESNFYDGEIRDFVLDAVEYALDRAIGPKARRRDVLQALLDHNQPGGEAAKRVDALKQLFKGFTHLDRATRKQLQDYGFEITDDGKHYKATWNGDERYVVSLPKSGSDGRTGGNLTSQFSNWFF